MAKDDDIIEIRADGRVVNTFSYKQRKKYKHLFRLAGIELVSLTTCETINKKAIYTDSLEEDNATT